MRFIKTKFKGLLIIEPQIFRDVRGFFMESYNRRKFSENGIPSEFVQDNISRSVKGTLRGLHYQLNPHSQGKLVRVTEGAVFDVAVDIRFGSPTFGQWFGYILSAENRHALYIPPGFAHGFCVLTDEAEFTYKCTAFYVPEAERAIIWNDPQIAIQWPITPDPNLMSEKDKNAPTLSRAEINFYF
ncbi:MAG TPA: dTDP-4-dehydrorhamnose 3,5-epimerase [Candidatus Limnocylindrales bacterium]|nr:dTDP-4-dehydrorhamnose 3,5-epimerase [Candidatus Limnocylindrales bacterium]